MDKEKIMEKIVRWQIKAEEFLEKNIGVYIKDIHNTYYFGYIILNGEKRITIDCYGPPQRDGKREYLNWIDIVEFDEDKNRGVQE